MSIFVLVGLFVVSFVFWIIYSIFFSEKASLPMWPIVLSICGVILSVITLIAFVFFNEKTTVPIETKSTKQVLSKVGQDDPEYYLRQIGGTFQYAYDEDNIIRTKEVKLKNSSVRYDAKNEAYVIIEKTEGETEYKLSFIRFKQKSTTAEYKFHLSNRDEILFEFENKN